MTQTYLLVSGDFVKTGGMDRANHALAIYLARQGNEVHIVAFRIDEELRRTPGVVFHRVPKPGGSYTLALPLLDWMGRAWARKLAVKDCCVVVNGGCCQWHDVNWVHYVHAAHQPEVRKGLARWAASAWNHRRWLDDERRAMLGTRIVIVNSERTRRDVIERIGVNADRVRVIYYGVDSEQFRPAREGEKEECRRKLGWNPERATIAFVGA